MKKIHKPFIIIISILFLIMPTILAKNSHEIILYKTNNKISVDNDIENINLYIIKEHNYISLDEFNFLLRNTNFLNLNENETEYSVDLSFKDEKKSFYGRSLFTDELGKKIEDIKYKAKINNRYITYYQINKIKYYNLSELCEAINIEINYDDKKQIIIIKTDKNNKINQNKKSEKITKQKVVVLMYHHILKKDDLLKYFGKNGSIINLDLFNEHMNFIKNSGYSTITGKQLENFIYNKKELPDSKDNTSILISFDDGYLSNYIYAYPIMKKLNLKGIIFHVTSNTATKSIDKIYPIQLDRLSTEQMALSDDVFEHASHSHISHSKNKNNIADLIYKNELEIENDLKLSSSITGGSKYFAYPFGEYNDRLINILKKNKYTLAFTVEKGYVKENSDPYKLKRHIIWPSTSLDELQKILKNAK